MSPVPIISLDQMRAMDAAAPAHGVSVRVLMEAAGRAVAETVMARLGPPATGGACGAGGRGGEGGLAGLGGNLGSSL